MNGNKKNILFVYTFFSSFVKTDFDILSSEFNVTRYQFKAAKGILKNSVAFFKQLIYLIFNIYRFDAIFIWFADYHSFFPVLFAKIFSKKSFVVIGGYDVANIPEYKYGSLSSPFRKKLTLFSLKNASLCLPVVESLEKELKVVCPASKSKTLYTGYEINKVDLNEIQAYREKIIITVGLTNGRQRIFIKGLDRFKELACELPDFRFIIIGVYENVKNLFEPIPKNLSIISPLDQNGIIEYYKKASFYAQFSRSEGLPNALCEAMLYGCIPLGLNIGGIPVAMGNNGFIKDFWEPKEVSDYIVKNHNSLNRQMISTFILKKFNIIYRIEFLRSLLSL